MSWSRTQWKLKLLSALMCSVGLVGCAIPTDPTPRVIAQNDVPPGLSNPKRTIQIFLVRATKAVAVRRSVPFGGGSLAIARAALAELKKPVPAIEASDSFESKVSNLTISLVGVRDKTAYLDVTQAPSLIEDGVALGQVVLTLTDLRGIDGVELQSSGKPVETVYSPEYEPLSPPVGRGPFESNLQVQDIARVYFVKNGYLEAVERRIPDPSPDDDAEALADKYLTPFAEVPPKGFESPVISLRPTLRCIDDSSSSSPATSTPTSSETVTPSQLSRVEGQPDCSLYVNAKAFRAMLPDDKALALGQILYTLSGWRTRAELGKVWVYMQPDGEDLVGVPKGATACLGSFPVTPAEAASAAASVESNCPSRQTSLPVPGGTRSEVEKSDYESLLADR